MSYPTPLSRSIGFLRSARLPTAGPERFQLLASDQPVTAVLATQVSFLAVPTKGRNGYT